jgi:hypothetical protein
MTGKIKERILRRDGMQEYRLDADRMEIIGEKTDALKGQNSQLTKSLPILMVSYAYFL